MAGRAFAAILAIGLLMAPLPGRAQAPARMARVGYLSDESSTLGATSFAPIEQGLRELGYQPGRTIAFEHRYAEGKIEALMSYGLSLPPSVLGRAQEILR